jgi:hypothetical protein
MVTAGTIDCVDCAAGKAQSSGGTTACSDCLPGKYQSSTGLATCITCGPSTYSTGGAVGCTECTSNSSSSIASGSSSAYDCICNQGYGGGRTSACSQCGIGTFRNSTMVTAGTTDCVTCYNGTYGISTGSTSCSICTAGHYCANGMQAICSVNCYCPSGSGQPTECPLNSQSSAQSTINTSCTCNGGYYGAAGDTCTQCEGGFRCSGGASHIVCSSNSFCPIGSPSESSCGVGSTSASQSDEATDCSCLPGMSLKPFLFIGV